MLIMPLTPMKTAPTHLRLLQILKGTQLGSNFSLTTSSLSKDSFRQNFNTSVAGSICSSWHEIRGNIGSF
ncbi:hypothetical protein FRX31_008790 [Thalictrum thalictroides]|uniref:Uncharacterized protein n=1 Tax=Thalictrum thalictroides TaxID=46969 RepID=A0A7J6WYH8_THATH|nr:hypothetical protein FRX31_008790 [Thalictrum thalictroides]